MSNFSKRSFSVFVASATLISLATFTSTASAKTAAQTIGGTAVSVGTTTTSDQKTAVTKNTGTTTLTKIAPKYPGFFASIGGFFVRLWNSL